ncbi:MAG: tRNA threonylcarbamoyladenosine biosynthesis protein TsaE [candidate division TA06 bacterium ADurb.Bin417]|uniref:tRNA threonylcarbamoyladenosine biosynthesis protein TsaE n=1 Tax=candidate division TA06 bacterium ADurb.Bin417 TaxID=1852828 RepID=A0A1V5MHA6_UNCT6|nr:MAG: tRNA threonylcarbamoyladenosine biosynthesis protein TsaE [candidate division TA06 bacterium ADurb.Bin417]
MKIKKITASPGKTRALAAELAGKLKGGEIISLAGPLGAGKTVFVQGLARGLGIPEKEVRSPSFVILNEYSGRLPLFHFDFYRLRTAAELASVPFRERLAQKGVVVMEWPERAAGLLPAGLIRVEIKVLDRARREIRIEKPAPAQKRRLSTAARKSGALKR